MKKNTVASALFIVGISAITVGILSGLYYGLNEEFMALGALQGIIGLTLFINGVVWGIVFFGFSEVIKLLQGIYNQREASFSETNSSVKETASNLDVNDVLGDNKVKISEVARNEILNFYSSKGLTVQEIASTDKEDFFLVTVDGKNETVELGGFYPVIHSS